MSIVDALAGKTINKVTVLVKPPKAPLPGASDLPCTHVCCDACDFGEPWLESFTAETWSCTWCGTAEPVWEHHARRPLGYANDRACHWTAVVLAGELIMPEQWVYHAKAPA